MRDAAIEKAYKLIGHTYRIIDIYSMDFMAPIDSVYLKDSNETVYYNDLAIVKVVDIQTFYNTEDYFGGSYLEILVIVEYI